MKYSERDSSIPDNPDSILSLIKPVVDKRLSIIKFTLIVALVCAAGSFLIRNKYTASGVILPDVDVLSAAQKFGSLQDLASSVGFNLGVTSPSQLYSDVMLSETILRPVILKEYSTKDQKQPVNLIQFFGYDNDDSLLNYERCLERLREKAVSIDVNKKTAILTLTVETTEPVLSAEIANAMIVQLDSYQRNFRRTNAYEQRKFLDRRLDEVQSDLTNSENALKDFREKNRRVSDSPLLSLEESRLVRTVEMNTAIYVELRKQYELVKLDEIKNTPVVQVLDYARPSAEKDSPKRLWIVIISSMLAFTFSSVWYIYRDNFKKTVAGTNNERLFSEMLGSLKGDGQKILMFLRRKSKQ